MPRMTSRVCTAAALFLALLSFGCDRTPPGTGWACGAEAPCPSGFACGIEGYCVPAGAPDGGPTTDADSVTPPPDVPDVPSGPDGDGGPAEVGPPLDVPDDGDTVTPPPDVPDVGDVPLDVVPPDADAVIPPPDVPDVGDVGDVRLDTPSDLTADQDGDAPPDTSCPRPCLTPGAIRCEEAGWSVCVDYGDGCFGWSEPSPCTDGGNTCQATTCLDGTGCVHTPRNDGTPCDDYDLCTSGEACYGGFCSGGRPLVCDDDDACTTDYCDPVDGCVFTAAPDGAPCTTGDECLEGETCQSGLCVGGDDICLCHEDADCAALDDADLCNGTHRCNTLLAPYTCEIDPTTIVVCDTSFDTACTPTACVPLTGACTQTTLPDTTPCDDGDPCTGNDVCTAGVCAGATVPDAIDDATCDGVDDDCDGEVDEDCPSGAYALRWQLVGGAGPSDTVAAEKGFFLIGRPSFQGSSFDGTYRVRPVAPRP